MSSSDLTQVNLNSRLPRQIVVYTDAKKTPENSYPLPPRAVRTIFITQDQLAYVRANYSRDVIIGEVAAAVPVVPDAPEEGNDNG